MSLLPKMTTVLHTQNQQVTRINNARNNLNKIRDERSEANMIDQDNARSGQQKMKIKQQFEKHQSKWGLTPSVLNDHDLTMTERQLSPDDIEAIKEVEQLVEPAHLQGRSGFTQADPFAIKIPLVAQFSVRHA